jgi:S-adenosylmethionine synthetase
LFNHAKHFRDLDLKKPIYQRTAENGHFGKSEFPWEHEKQLHLAKHIQEKIAAQKKFRM